MSEITLEKGVLTIEDDDKASVVQFDFGDRTSLQIDCFYSAVSFKPMIVLLTSDDADELYRFLGINNGRAERCRSLPIE